ncbi:hypothetical protein M0Q50_08535 [bacterium]|jgi:hypothetical protein|nr:hypothetical protein [bacterium]
MKTFEHFEVIDEKEKLFLELAHLDELEIKFDFIEYPKNIYYFYKDTWLFNQDKKFNYFWINYDKIWIVFSSKFDINYKEIGYYMSDILEKHFKLNGYETISSNNPITKRIDTHFKL